MATIEKPAPAEHLLGRRRRRSWTPAGLTNRFAFWVALWTATTLSELAALWPVLFGEGPVTAGNTIYRATGGSFAAAGLIAWRRRPANPVGRLMVATGFLFFVEVLARDLESPAAQTLGLLVAGYWMIPFVVLLLVFPQARWITGRLEAALVIVFASHLALQPVWLLFLERPGLENELGFFPSERGAEWIHKVQTGVLLLAATSLFLVVAWRWWRASPPLRRILVPVLAGGATMLSLAVMLTLELINGARSQPLVDLTLGVLAVVPLAFLGGLLRSRLARVAVGDLLVGLPDRPTPVELQEALARSVGDPRLDLVYWLPDYNSYADLHGRAVAVPAADGRAATLIDRNGAHVAALLHDPALEDEPDLLQAVGAAAGIALENARLQAELAARLEEVKGSRLRAIEAGRRERKRLERNLHDGAQQRLIALSLELSLLGTKLAAHPEAQKGLEEARHELALSLEELRDLARGIHPAVLSGHGLDVALEQICALAPVPVKLRIVPGERLPESVEVAAYYVVTESLANVAKHAQASSVQVDVIREDDVVVVEIVDDGIGGADSERGSGIRGLADRVEALGGRIRIWSPRGGGTRVRAEIPCD
jgi:signal transduction histidine kinase